MRSLNLDQLRTLLAVVEQGSFSAAAQQLNLSQPAVSLQVRELEARFGIELIERLGKKAYATAAGRELVEHAQRLMHGEETVLAAMRRHREGLIGRVRIGTNAHYLIYYLPPVLRRLRAEFPMIELVITSGTSRGVLERMQRNEIDVGLVTLPADERAFEVTRVRSDPIFAALPATYTEIPETVTPDYASSQPLVVEHRRSAVGMLINRWFENAGIALRPTMELDNVEALMIVVAAGLGISFVDDLPGFKARSDAAEGIAFRPLEPPLHRDIGVAVRRDKPDDPALKAVREALLMVAN